MLSEAVAPEERLAHLEALTDTALNRLGVDDLLAELLSRVREIFDADTAAVLLLAEGSRHLVARAACGIEEEVHQGVRVPLGSGFAGRVAATRSPIRLDRVDSTTVSNPVLWEKGIKVMLGIPLLSGDKLIGVLHIGRLEDRPFTAEDATLLQVVGDRVAGATQARQMAIERAAAVMLERSLAPAILPVCEGLELAARYVPTEERIVGGDWYDVFKAEDGQLWIVVGDVAGHGLSAAVIMGRVRSALRAYALLGVGPATLLEYLDRKVEHFEMGTLVTVACAVSEPPYDAMTVALAGHLPPVIASPEGATTLVDVGVGPPLGIGTKRRRSDASFELPPGALIAFYTDGLIERRGESIELGLTRLQQATTVGEPEHVARDIMRKLVGQYVPEDDIALVVARRNENARL